PAARTIFTTHVRHLAQFLARLYDVFGYTQTRCVQTSINTMSKKTTRQKLAERRQYVTELIDTSYWGKVNRFEDHVEGWRPSGELRKRLILEEIGDLTREIIAAKQMIGRLPNLQPDPVKLPARIAAQRRYITELESL